MAHDENIGSTTLTSAVSEDDSFKDPATKLCRADASRYLRKRGVRAATSTLAKLAVTGGGLTLYYDGRFPTYAVGDLDAYAEARISGPFKSTSEKARNATKRRHETAKADDTGDAGDDDADDAPDHVRR